MALAGGRRVLRLAPCLGLAGTLAALAGGCGEGGPSSPSPEGRYAARVQRVFDRSCVPGCDSGADPTAGLDLDALVVIHLVEVGSSPNLEGPHNIWLDGPQRRWYASLINAGPRELWQFDAETDAFLGRCEVGDSPANGGEGLATGGGVGRGGHRTRTVRPVTTRPPASSL